MIPDDILHGGFLYLAVQKLGLKIGGREKVRRDHLSQILSYVMNQFTGAISQIIGIESAINLEIKISTRIYEAVHGSAPDIAGQDKEPMLRHMWGCRTTLWQENR